MSQGTLPEVPRDISADYYAAFNSSQHQNQLGVVGPLSRYFLIKSFTVENVRASMQRGVWATTPKTEHLLTQAFNTGPVILIFSINASSRFSGFATMLSRPGECEVPSNVFVAPDGRPFWGRTFAVEWKRRTELPFAECANIKNALNENKPVKIGRDGQEIAADAGRELCDLLAWRESSERAGERRYSGGGYMSYEVVGGPGTMDSPYNHQQEQMPSSGNSHTHPIPQQQHPAVVSSEAAKQNPVLQVFPIDLTPMSYSEYRDLYKANLQQQQQHRGIEQT